jgi:hypothetical protein
LAFSAECAGTVRLNFAEGFGTAFRIQGTTDQNMVGTLYNTESGFTPSPIIAGVGTADSGTELGAVISGLEPGVQLFVPPTVTRGSLTVTAVEPPGGGMVPVVGGQATIVYEVTAASASQFEAITIPVTVGSLESRPPPAVVRGNLYPISTVMTASADAPIPRFADVSTELPLVLTCAAAPAMSWWSLLVLSFALFGVGVMMVRRLGRA